MFGRGRGGRDAKRDAKRGRCRLYPGFAAAGGRAFVYGGITSQGIVRARPPARVAARPWVLKRRDAVT